jgi:hypothetical protein
MHAEVIAVTRPGGAEDPCDVRVSGDFLDSLADDVSWLSPADEDQ